jgi:hypothetical protein
VRRVLQVVSWAALAATVLPAVLFFRDALGLDETKLWTLAGTLAWFAATPFWMGRE